MLNIKKLDNGYVIEDKLFIWNALYENYINLFLNKGEDIIMGCEVNKKIDYPWEYEIDSIYFKVFEIDWKLNYIISNFKAKNLAFIQSPEILEKEEFDHIDIWLFSNPLVEEFLDKLEYEGEKIKLD